MLLLTWLSYTLVIAREAYAQRKKNNVISDDKLILNEIFWDLCERNDHLRGQIVIKVESAHEVDWTQKASELKKQINKRISLEFISNDVMVYSRYSNIDNSPNDDNVIH
ncbi:hypothetical protein D3C76_193520 [compost metagenome]